MNNKIILAWVGSRQRLQVDWIVQRRLEYFLSYRSGISRALGIP